MAAKKQVLTKDDKLQLSVAAALCIAKAILEAENPLLGVAGPVLAKEAAKLLAASGVNFVGLITKAKQSESLPKLCQAFEKVMAQVNEK